MGLFGKLFRKKDTIVLGGSDYPERTPESFAPMKRDGPWDYQKFDVSQEKMQPDYGQDFTSPTDQYEQPPVFPDINQAPARDYPPAPSYSSYREQPIEINNKDIQLILSKLDLISSRLENLNRRLEALDASRKVERHLW